MNFEITALVFLSVLTLLGSVSSYVVYKKEGGRIVFMLFHITCVIVCSLSTTYLIVKFVA